MSKRTEIKPEFVGLAAINNFLANTSSPRATMDYSHWAQRVPLLTPDERLIKSGMEYELGKYINDVRTTENCVVKAVVPRYKEYGIEPPSTSVFVEYEKDYEDGKGPQLVIDVIDVPTYRTSHGFFGYNLEPTDTLINTEYGTPLPKDTLLAKTASYGSEGSYKFGLNANVAFMSHPSVAEDGFVISESFAKRAQFTSITKRIININKNTIPLNLYGTKDDYRFLPDIGQKVRPDGLLCALRERNDWFSVYDMSDANLCEVDMTFDEKTYVNVDSTVVDIQIIRGNGKPEFSSKMTQQLDNYADMLNNYYSRIVGKYEQLLAEKKSLYGSLDNVRLSPRTHRLITDSYVKLNSSTNRKNTLCYRKLPIDQYRIEITTRSVITPDLGYKLTDIHASKGVVCLILPDEKMPVDKNGVRVDILTDSASTISRMNIGRAYESYIGATSRDNRYRLIHMLKSSFGDIVMTDPPQAALEIAKDYLRELYALFNSDMVQFIDSLNYEELRHHVLTVLNENMYIYYPCDNERNVVDVISDIEQSKYRPLNDTLTYVNDIGEVVETREPIQVGVMYFMFLEKIASLYSAVSSSKVNNFGFPVKGASVDKHKYPHSQTPTKLLAETENRILVSHIGVEAVADMIDLALNPTSHKTVYKDIIQSPVAYNTEFDVDRSDIPYGNTKSLQTLNHIFTAAGFVMVHEEDIHAKNNG